MEPSLDPSRVSLALSSGTLLWRFPLALSSSAFLWRFPLALASGAFLWRLPLALSSGALAASASASAGTASASVCASSFRLRLCHCPPTHACVAASSPPRRTDAGCVIQYGYVVYFSVSWPMAPVVCAIHTMFRLRSNVLRLTKCSMRPQASAPHHLGPHTKPHMPGLLLAWPSARLAERSPGRVLPPTPRIPPTHSPSCSPHPNPSTPGGGGGLDWSVGDSPTV